MKTQAYIFDFDGVLVNTMELHYACYKQALEEVGVPIDKEKFYRHAGMTGKEQIKYFADKAGVSVDVERVYQRNRELKSKYAHQVRAIAANIELLRTVRSSGHRVAIATGSSIKSVAPIIKQFNIEVDAIVTAESVNRGKPHPDLFICAAQQLGVPPEHCTVIEDADVGVEAAQAAGMKVLRFFNNTPSNPTSR